MPQGHDAAPHVHTIKGLGQTPIYWTGRPLAEGPLPGIFYFCTSGHDTLAYDPFDQFVKPLLNYPVRLFSLTLPLHEERAEHKSGVARWAKAFGQGHDPLTPFLDTVREAIYFLVAQQIVDPKAIAAAGLSRGGFIATHLAARTPEIRAILGFAPLTQLFHLEELRGITDNYLLDLADLSSQVDQLVGRPLRYYIGNRDTMVGTDICYAFIRRLTEASHTRRVRSLPVELVISPSIGHQGHGTAPQTFQSGAEWILGQLCKGTVS